MTEPAADLDLTRWIRPGDTVVWGQACAEPRALTAALVQARHELDGIRCVVGIPATTTLKPDTVDGIDVVSYCGSGGNAALDQAGLLDVLPVHYSTLPALLTTGALRADVVLVQVSPADAQGRHCLGLGDDYFSSAIDTARVVLVEVNRHVPFVDGARTIATGDWAHAVWSDVPPAQMPAGVPSDTVAAVADSVADLVDDGVTLQIGIGALPDAVLGRLHDRTDLGFHSGILTDGVMSLITSGAASGAAKTVDPGVAVGGSLVGTAELFEFAHHNPRITLRPTGYTHRIDVLAAQHRLTAINSAVEVDLTGAVNAETVGDRYVGAVGGAMDFLRGAALSPGGTPIVALPSTARGRSRIVAHLSGPVSTPRADAGLIVTEHGHADLRGLSISARVEAMIAVAAPEHRDELADSAARLATREVTA
ncbi:acetyl-CoA hydrolase/transferase C-terminal domain-containing protein [uncultured Williamsia sp.]|uniref:acetyl-CoA hydrolase/transferase family protein n=1 Tax=uncultured Williamsia sp. TaxID=259311 RepID=UPI0026144B7C|nr:acetyl-CoA hydrolase/transferase C-terminal domain-containing protein [uncultured Williamsia sp.]